MKAAGVTAQAEAEKRAVGLQNQVQWFAKLLNAPDNSKKTCGDALKEWRAQP